MFFHYETFLFLFFQLNWSVQSTIESEKNTTKAHFLSYFNFIILNKTSIFSFNALSCYLKSVIEKCIYT